MKDDDGSPMSMSASANTNRWIARSAPPAALLGMVALVSSPSLAGSALGLVLLVASFSLRPGGALPILGLTLPFFLMPRTLGSMEFSMPELVLLCGLAGTVFHAFIGWIRGIRATAEELATPFDAPVALFLAAALLSLLASEVLRVSLRDMRTLILEPVVAYYLAAWFLRSERDRGWLLASLLAGGGAAALMGLYQYLFTDHVIAVEGSRRILGPYLSPNHLGLYLGRLLPMALAVALFLPRQRRAALMAVAVLLAAQSLTYSLGAWLATGLALLAVLLLWKSRVALLAAGAATALVVGSLPLLSLERVASHFSLTRGTSFIRLQLWDSALRMIGDHPLLGVGMDNFLYQYRSGYLLPEAVAEPNLSHPHNLVLNFWLQMGLLGVAALIWLLASLARGWYLLWRNRKTALEAALLVGIAGATVDLVSHGLVDNSYFLVDLAFHFWLSAGLLASMISPFSLRPNRVNYGGPAGR